ncbi:MAG TPA: chromate transporter [Roseomonas sp.]|jgi:chromate transporter
MAEAAPSVTVTPTLADLFLGYAKVGLLGFGGVGAWARRVIVEERRWLTERDYAEVLGIGQVLPGPNVGNAAVMIGRRFHGLAGALSATSGIYIGPFCILMLLALAYQAYGQMPAVAPFMHGIAAAAAGMVMGMAAKMTSKLKPPPEMIAVGLLACAAAFWWRLPLPLIVAIMAPVSVFLAHRRLPAAVRRAA